MGLENSTELLTQSYGCKDEPAVISTFIVLIMFSSYILCFLYFVCYKYIYFGLLCVFVYASKFTHGQSCCQDQGPAEFHKKTGVKLTASMCVFTSMSVCPVWNIPVCLSILNVFEWERVCALLSHHHHQGLKLHRPSDFYPAFDWWQVNARAGRVSSILTSIDAWNGLDFYFTFHNVISMLVVVIVIFILHLCKSSVLTVLIKRLITAYFLARVSHMYFFFAMNLACETVMVPKALQILAQCPLWRK